MSTRKYLSASKYACSCSMMKKEKLFCSALGTFRKERERKYLLDIDPLSSEKL